MAYNPLTRRTQLNDDASVNYLFATRKPLKQVS
jgi:2-polyprenyl-3-methyl-5-hydroxy-6-metoxy-1,4-benzoquinol methylase